jgi:exonuclease SbcC
LASKNIEVQSLFLDEGFGTLDEEALDTAIGVLAEIPHEIPGKEKVLGLISHVPALAARINTQIKVIPLGNGHSILEGPGCRQIS